MMLASGVTVFDSEWFSQRSGHDELTRPASDPFMWGLMIMLLMLMSHVWVSLGFYFIWSRSVQMRLPLLLNSMQTVKTRCLCFLPRYVAFWMEYNNTREKKDKFNFQCWRSVQIAIVHFYEDRLDLKCLLPSFQNEFWKERKPSPVCPLSLTIWPPLLLSTCILRLCLFRCRS